MGSRETDHHWLAIRLIGVRSNRDAIGAKIKLTIADGRAQFNYVTTSVGYASSSDVRAHFGLGRGAKVKEVEIRWPGGNAQMIKVAKSDRHLTIAEETK